MCVRKNRNSIATSYGSDTTVAAGQVPEKRVAPKWKTKEEELRKSEKSRQLIFA